MEETGLQRSGCADAVMTGQEIFFFFFFSGGGTVGSKTGQRTSSFSWSFGCSQDKALSAWGGVISAPVGLEHKKITSASAGTGAAGRSHLAAWPCCSWRYQCYTRNWGALALNFSLCSYLREGAASSAESPAQQLNQQSCLALWRRIFSSLGE